MRFAAALLALLALTFSFAEGVWASSCVPGMAMGEMSTQSESAGCMPGAMANAAPDDGSLPEAPADSHCPFAPLSTTGACVVAASLPAHSNLDLTPADAGVLLIQLREQTPDLLLGSVLFHPPKA